MQLSDFLYELPEELIAQRPVESRTGSRLLVVDRASGSITDTAFVRLGDWLAAGDCLVFNDTKVMPARLLGVVADAAAPVEALLVRRIDDSAWEAMVRPGRRMRPGARVAFGGGRLLAEVEETLASGHRVIRFAASGASLDDAISEEGVTPLPPYIKSPLADPSRYQTVYADEAGSAAAPTAGLHFTREFIAGLEAAGVASAYLTLHVGPGTFQPVRCEAIEGHRMHEERFSIGDAAARAINGAKGRLVAVGTTSVRAIESVASEDGRVVAREGSTDIFIYPGYKWKRVDAMLTNFHLPGSTLLMLVCAFAGRGLAMEAYRHAVAERYRFFSFGDAMLIV